MTDSGLPNKILLIDDDSSILEAVHSQLAKHGVKVEKAANLQTSLYHFNQQKFEVAIIELEFDELSGLAIAQKFRQSDSDERSSIGIVIACGSKRSVNDEALLKELGGMEFVEKPLTGPKLLSIISRAAERRRKQMVYGEVSTLAYQVLEKTRDVAKAVKAADKGLTNQEDRKAHLIADLFEKDEKYSEALEVVDKALKAEPRSISYINQKARLLIKLGEVEQAKDYFEEADKIAPGNLERIEAMSKLYLDTEEPKKCVEKMKELIVLNPENNEIQFDFFEELNARGFRDHGLNLVKESSSPKEVVRFYNNKGVVRAKNGEKDEALRDYYTAIMFFPKNKENYRILFNIALAELKKGTKEGYLAAQDALKKCLALEGGFEKGINLLEQVNKALEGKKAG